MYNRALYEKLLILFLVLLIPVFFAACDNGDLLPGDNDLLDDEIEDADFELSSDYFGLEVGNEWKFKIVETYESRKYKDGTLIDEEDSEHIFIEILSVVNEEEMKMGDYDLTVFTLERSTDENGDTELEYIGRDAENNYYRVGIEDEEIDLMISTPIKAMDTITMELGEDSFFDLTTEEKEIIILPEGRVEGWVFRKETILDDEDEDPYSGTEAKAEYCVVPYIGHVLFKMNVAFDGYVEKFDEDIIWEFNIVQELIDFTVQE